MRHGPTSRERRDDCIRTPERLPLLGACRSRCARWPGATARPVSVRQFLADVERQAGLLPGRGALLNLCTDRYRFAVGFGAALCRGQVHLMPPNVLPDTLAQLGARRRALHALTDEPVDLPASIASLPVPLEPAPPRPVEIPAFDRGQLAATLLTSGSTGVPQPHAKSWGQLTLNVAAAARRLAELLAASRPARPEHRRHRAGTAQLRLRIDGAARPARRRRLRCRAAVLPGRHRALAGRAAASARAGDDAVPPQDAAAVGASSCRRSTWC